MSFLFLEENEMEFGNVICVDHEKIDKKFLLSVKKTLKEGKTLGIFPEGKRSAGFQTRLEAFVNMIKRKNM